MLPYEEEENLQPIVVQVISPLSSIQIDNPPATIGIPGKTAHK
jgi:hypothetical protein